MELLSSVNFHLWQACNMRCKFCFATFQDVKRDFVPKGHLPREQAIKVIVALAKTGFKKITFAGGEPTLCPWLPDLLRAAKERDMTTMIVTNGSKINDGFLSDNRSLLDWVAVSIDSLNTYTNLQAGRATSGHPPMSMIQYFEVIDCIRRHGLGVKINTVVTKLNWEEDLTGLICAGRPERWKIFQVLPITGQNDKHIESLKISEDEFNALVERHRSLEKVTTVVPENNDQMTNSYAMVDPAGRFYTNKLGKHSYSKPILEVGTKQALSEVGYSLEKFINRGGIYNWKNPNLVTVSS